jgi:hypothetical protein
MFTKIKDDVGWFLTYETKYDPVTEITTGTLTGSNVSVREFKLTEEDVHLFFRKWALSKGFTLEDGTFIPKFIRDFSHLNGFTNPQKKHWNAKPPQKATLKVVIDDDLIPASS